MFFMNYSGMETASARVLKYAQDLNHVEGTMYQSTKDKVENSIKNCEKSIEIMKKFLEEHKDDNTSSGSGRRSMIDYEEMDKRYVTREEFNEKMDELNGKVDDVLDKLGQLLQKSVSAVSDIAESVKSTVIPDPYDPKFAKDESTKPYLNLPDNATKSEKRKKEKDNRKLMRQNHELLSKLSEEVRQNCNYHELIECAELVSYWFDHRFKPDQYPTQGYNADLILKYTEQVIGAYAYYWVQGDVKLNQFVSEFKKWCDNLSQSNNSYMYPYSVGKIKYTDEWVESDAVASNDDYKWVMLSSFLSSAIACVSKSYSKFRKAYFQKDRYDDLVDTFGEEGRIACAVFKGDVCDSDSKLSRLCGAYCRLESTYISDEDRYNTMLDQPVCFA